MSETEGFRGRVLVLGGRGMLGREVAREARKARYQVWVSGSEHDIASLSTMRKLDESIHPHFVVNCAGIIPAKLGAKMPAEMIRVNGYGPWVVRQAFPYARIIQISTDCVFSGLRLGAYRINDVPDPIDVYGRSKMMGEVPGTTVVRTSFIGLDHGLLRWFLDQQDGAKITGWTHTFWSGATVLDVAESIVRLFNRGPAIEHLSATSISKFWLLRHLIDITGKNVVLVPSDVPRINRALFPTVRMERRLDALFMTAAV